MNKINGIDVSEEHKNCKYRFKGKSCEDCPLNCKFKCLQEENKRLNQELDIKEKMLEWVLEDSENENPKHI